MLSPKQRGCLQAYRYLVERYHRLGLAGDTQDSSATAAENAAGANPLPQQPVILSERSLTLLALVRIFVGLLWFQQLAWKMPPTFGGLRRYVESEAQHTFVPGYSAILTNVFLTHFSLLGTLVWAAELLVGVTLLFGLFTRFGALLALLLSVQLYVGLTYAPREWYWTYGMLVLLALGLLAVPAGRRLGLDQLLAPCMQQATRKSRLAGFGGLAHSSRLLPLGRHIKRLLAKRGVPTFFSSVSPLSKRGWNNFRSN